MVRSQSRGRSRGTSRNQRKFIWARSPNFSQAVAGTGAPSNTDILANFETAYGAQLIGCTVTRIRGFVLVNYDNLANVGTTLTVGIRVYGQSDTLATQGGPISDPHLDWMFYHASHLSTATTSETEYAMDRYEFDVRSMRKVDELESGLMLSAQSDSTSAISVKYSLSVGIKLP